jgi:hypothetical protein
MPPQEFLPIFEGVVFTSSIPLLSICYKRKMETTLFSYSLPSSVCIPPLHMHGFFQGEAQTAKYGSLLI